MEVVDILNEREKKTRAKKERLEKGIKPQKVRKLTKKEQEILELANNTVMPENYYTVLTEEELDDFCDWLSIQKVVAIDTETMGLKPFVDEIVGISFYSPNRS